MPKIIATTVYIYDELRAEKAKGAALNWLRESCYQDEWWDFVYEDAAQIGLKIKGFDLDSYGNVKDVDGEFIISALECSEAIFANHGESCATYATARKYDAAIDALPELPPEGHPKYWETERELCETETR